MTAITPVFVIGILTYIRPNHLLFLIPYLAFLWMQFADLRIDRRLIRLGLAASFFIMVMLPWSTWISVQNQTLMPLSTTQGSTLYLATAEGNRRNPQEIYAMETEKGEAIASQYYESLAQRAWRSNPVGNTKYGFKKILHTFGLWFQRVMDWVMGLQLILAIASAVWLWQSRRYLPWVFFFCGTIGVTALQSFIFQQGFRFKLVLFDLPALLILSLGSTGLFTGFFAQKISHKTP